MKRHLPPLLFAMLATMTSAQPALNRLARPDSPGRADSVRVADGPLVFTGQVTAVGAGADARAQAEAALDALGVELRALGSDLGRVVRLNIHVATDAVAPAVEAVVAARFAKEPPACTLTRTPPRVAGELVAFEAVAASSRVAGSVETRGAAALLPAGGKVFVSGQAEKGADLGEASRLTMEQLFRTLAHVGARAGDVVQVRAFVKPWAERAAAERAIAASFGTRPVPPVVLMEWDGEWPAEIELVAASGTPPPDGAQLAHTFLPWFTRTPRFCHVAQVAAGTPLIFLGGIDGGEDGGSRAQLKRIFERLGSALFDAGASYRSLAKATYYMTEPGATPLLAEIRGVYYDPSRPPAASGVRVAGLGRPGRTVVVDMIATPVRK